MDLELEPEIDPASQLMTAEQFDQEAAVAAQGGWEELGLDELPENWQASSIEELRNAE